MAGTVTLVSKVAVSAARRPAGSRITFSPPRCAFHCSSAICRWWLDAISALLAELKCGWLLEYSHSSLSLGHPPKLRLPSYRHRMRRIMRLCRFFGNHYGHLSEPLAQLFDPSSARSIGQARIESQHFH